MVIDVDIGVADSFGLVDKMLDVVFGETVLAMVIAVVVEDFLEFDGDTLGDGVTFL